MNLFPKMLNCVFSKNLLEIFAYALNTNTAHIMMHIC